jgi:transcriptional regulator with XRE-family HTH domain
MAKIKKSKKTSSLKTLGAPTTITRASSGGFNTKLFNPTVARNLEFGRRLRSLMMEKGIRQIRMAELLGIGRDNMSLYANGKNIPNAERLEKVCLILGCKPADLVPVVGVDVPGAEMKPGANIEITEDKQAWLTITYARAKMPVADAVKIMDQLNITAKTDTNS